MADEIGATPIIEELQEAIEVLKQRDPAAIFALLLLPYFLTFFFFILQINCGQIMPLLYLIPMVPPYLLKAHHIYLNDILHFYRRLVAHTLKDF